MITERRRAIRLPMALPVELEEGPGITRDVSLSGVFFETEQPFSSEAPINLSLVFEGRSWSRSIRLKCKGDVVRVEPGDGKVAITVTISSDWFAPQELSALAE
ncbi:MAG: PilZ domain-containing protein [Candidatus Methylomirabilales bacterium]